AVMGYADGAAVTAYVAQYDETDGDIDRVVNWYEINGKFYFFIPASINYDAAKFFITGGNVTVDSATYAEAKTLTEVFGDKTEVKVGSDGRTFDVVIVNESKTASVFINTESGNLDYIHAQKGNEEEGLIEIVDAEGNTVYEGGLEIKGRGNSTWQMEKKPYNIKLDDKENLFDMGKTKKWSLIANHGDDSMIRNVLAYEAAERAGMPYNPQFTPVDVYINGNYMGAYLLTTRIGIDKSNVDIEDLEGETEDANDEDLETYPRGGYYGKYAGLLEGTKKWFEIPNDPADITGGYIIEMELANRYADEASGFVTTRSQPFTMKTPEYASKAQMEYISDYYQKVEDAIYNGASMAELGKLVNVESLAQMYIINEWASNQDASLTSTYFYKPANDVLYGGPVWDFDIAFGNNDSGRFGNDYKDPTKWTVCYNRMYRNTVFGLWDVDEQPTVYNVLTKNAAFISEVEKEWNSDAKAAINETISWATDTYIPAIEGSAVANAIRWNIFGTLDAAQIKAEFAKATKEVTDFATIKSATMNSGIGKVQDDAPETNFILKALKQILVGINTAFEKLIVLFGLVNKI
ncbi:MAG: CotH kinase family protein, partial [Clostridia bacterium]|nr:CotH kinase family protein [Clostridia bacterium]